ncbi:MAG: YjjG family noncanonical pyrimidine nucleotidase [Lysinibacillus sp.]
MSKYEVLLFDVDDTLLDFDLSEGVALEKLFAQENVQVTPEMLVRYKEINESMWRAFERGEVEKQTLHNTRFSVFFKEYGIEVDGAHFEAGFQQHLENAYHFVEGAYELIASLSKKHSLYVVSNGKTTTQNKRLKQAKLMQYFDGIFISEQTGYQKPMPAFFDYVFDHVKGINKKSTLIIGDSLTADVKGGLQYGIDTCWFNYHNVEQPKDIKPDYEIKQLKELYEVLAH